MLTIAAPQAYGAGNYEAVGHWCQRAMVILGLVCIPISAVWLSAQPLLLALGQEVAVARMTAAYIRLLVPGLFASSVNYSITFYLQSQGIMRPGAHLEVRSPQCTFALLPRSASCHLSRLLSLPCLQEP